MKFEHIPKNSSDPVIEYTDVEFQKLVEAGLVIDGRKGGLVKAKAERSRGIPLIFRFGDRYFAQSTVRSGEFILIRRVRPCHARAVWYIAGVNRLLAIILVTACSCGLAADDPQPILGADGVRISFQNAATPISVALVPEDDTPVVLQKLVVTDWWAKARVGKSFEVTSEPWLKGVLNWDGKKWATKDFGPVRAELGTWFKFGEKETGAITERDVYIKVELVRLRW